MVHWNKGVFRAAAALGVMISLFGCLDYSTAAKKSRQGLTAEDVRITYFIGGRTHGLLRAYLHGSFEDENLSVGLYTRFLRETRWLKIPREETEFKRLWSAKRKKGIVMSRTWGKVDGLSIIEAMEKGGFEGGTPGESSFVYLVNRGSPIVAVAMLGHEDKDRPAKAICVRPGLKIEKPSDFKGKRFISRRAGPGDAIFLREFLDSIGLDAEKDVTIVDQVNDDLQEDLLKSGKADVLLLHVRAAPQSEQEGSGYFYRLMDWMDPELSHVLLVFRRDFIASHPDKVKMFLRAYMRRIKYEKGLPKEERDKSALFGIRIAEQPNALIHHIFDYPPLVRLDLLEEIQRLLLKYKFIDKKVDLAPFVNNEFVKEIYEELEREDAR